MANNAKDIDSLINLIEKPFDKDYDSEQISFYIKNWSEGTFCNNALNIIDDLVDQKKYSLLNEPPSFLILVFLKIFNKLKVFYSLYFGTGKRRRKKFKQKFKGFNYKHVKSIINSYTDRKDIKLSEEWPGIFLIEKI